MTNGSQNKVQRFLSDPKSFKDGATKVDIIQTHGAIVFLGKRNAYKMKRAVSYSYLDFSTLNKRRAVCEREIELNRVAAPDVYIDVVPITEDANGALAFNGDGEIVEYVVHMKRFRQADILDEIAASGRFSFDLSHALGLRLAAYHKNLPLLENPENARPLSQIAGELSDTFKTYDFLPADEALAFEAMSAELRESLSSVFAERVDAGFVRRCHGDLHLKNIVCLNGDPTPFDALEFDEGMATSDVLYDFAFLIMDMLHKDLKMQANAAFNAYASHAWTFLLQGGLRLFPLYLGLRAGIRAMVSAQTADHDEDSAPKLQETAWSYLRLANSFMKPAPPVLVAIGGLSGTGKSTLARRLASDLGPAPGAVILRSDVERKALFGMSPLETLPKHAYEREVSEEVYAILLDKAKLVLAQGHAVILDAAHTQQEEREGARDLAVRFNVSFHGFWLEAPSDILFGRVRARSNDASDADETVVRMQIERHRDVAKALGEAWHSIDASGTVEETKLRADAILAFYEETRQPDLVRSHN